MQRKLTFAMFWHWGAHCIRIEQLLQEKIEKKVFFDIHNKKNSLYIETVMVSFHFLLKCSRNFSFTTSYRGKHESSFKNVLVRSMDDYNLHFCFKNWYVILLRIHISLFSKRSVKMFCIITISLTTVSL